MKTYVHTGITMTKKDHERLLKAREANWKGKHEQRFNWQSLKFEWGRMCYNTNFNGETLASWWEKE